MATAHGSNGMTLRRYALPGQQIEPTAGLWLTRKPPITVPTLGEVTAIAESSNAKGDPRFRIDPKNDFPASADELQDQLAILVALQKARSVEPYPKQVAVRGGAPFPLTPISRFLQLQPMPFGTIFDTKDHKQPDVTNVLEQHLRILTPMPLADDGEELARIFENETPGLFHRHALNWAFFNRIDISPPRQARVWMALDMAIYAALGAAWYYKWLHDDYSRLLRPEEFDGQDGELEVLFDRPVKDDGQENPKLPPRTCPQPTPGTPRHPAWPSGHSTFSAAASHILEYFFSPATLGFSDDPEKKRAHSTPDEVLFKRFPSGSEDIGNPRWLAAELRRLANNIGEARLWAGVHWVSDHVAGQKIGRAAAEAVIAKLRANCIPPVDERSCEEAARDKPPTDKQIRAAFKAGCDDEIPPRTDRGAAFLASRGGF